MFRSHTQSDEIKGLIFAAILSVIPLISIAGFALSMANSESPLGSTSNASISDSDRSREH